VERALGSRARRAIRAGRHVCLHGTYHRGTAGAVLQLKGLTSGRDAITDFLEEVKWAVGAPTNLGASNHFRPRAMTPSNPAASALPLLLQTMRGACYLL
jgi:hypothetical protein